MDHQGQEQIALHRWAVIAEAAGDRLTSGERGRWPARSGCFGAGFDEGEALVAEVGDDLKAAAEGFDVGG